MEINDVVTTEVVEEITDEFFGKACLLRFGQGICIGVIGTIAGQHLVRFIRNKIKDKRTKKETEVDGIEIVADVESFEVD